MLIDPELLNVGWLDVGVIGRSWPGLGRDDVNLLGE